VQICTAWSVKPGRRKEPAWTNPAFIPISALLLIPATKNCSNFYAGLRDLPGVKQVFTGYGVRYDLALKDEEYLEELCAYHISGQLRIAPEHFSRQVTNAMCKPGQGSLRKVCPKIYSPSTGSAGKEQYIVNYLMSGHPGLYS